MTINRGRALGVLIGALAVGAWTIATDQLKLAAESKLWVDGTSTVRSFSCKAGAVDAQFEIATENAVAAVLGGENGVKALTFSVTADKLDCGNGTMNGHMLKAIKARDFPAIVFQLESYTIAKAAESTATLRGTLRLGGVARPIVLEAKVSAAPEGAMRVAGVYDLNMKDYQLTPPTLMLGALKVGERVKVNFDLVLR